MKNSLDSKDQVIEDYKAQVEELIKENATLSRQKEQAESAKMILTSKLVISAPTN